MTQKPCRQRASSSVHKGNHGCQKSQVSWLNSTSGNMDARNICFGVYVALFNTQEALVGENFATTGLQIFK